MPFWDLQDQLGINADKWMLHQSSEQPYKRAALCHAFEKEWIECASGIGQIRARKECGPEYEDFQECINRHKTVRRYELDMGGGGNEVEGMYITHSVNTGINNKGYAKFSVQNKKQ